MTAFEKIKNSISGAAKKVAHATSVAKRAEGKLEHWRKVRDSHAKGTPGRARANRKLRRWTTVYKRALQARNGWQRVLNRRIAKKNAYQKKHPPGPHPDGDGLTTFDGRQVCDWIAKILSDARRAGAWHGSVLSGWRSAEYCRQLCRNICGRDRCPGLCAGESSNHTQVGNLAGAVDVSDPAGLRAYCRAHGLPLHGGGEVLSRDLNHFSHSGQ